MKGHARSQYKTKVVTLLIAIFAIAALYSCDDGSDCSMNNTSYNRIRIYSINAITGKESTAEYNGTLSVSLMVNGKDSIVINQVKGTQDLAIPMSYTHDCDTVIFTYDRIYTDTLYVGHSNTPYFISLTCGTGMFHTLKEIRYTQSIIDSAAIINHTINYDPNENIKLYISQ